MSEVIASFEKNSFEEVRISLTEFKGKDLIDLRVYYRPEDGEEMRPTKKGVTISPEKFPELKKAILELEKALQKKGK
ncbi:MAG: transcriptional coactivator p15/PC4 family protein [Pseudomonadota bacterium]